MRILVSVVLLRRIQVIKSFADLMDIKIHRMDTINQNQTEPAVHVDLAAVSAQRHSSRGEKHSRGQ